ncbi:mannosyltransferase [Arachnomyces sp. PD_36]|nr:mannosyltransferase [Arachnomyces sp. PD_36]
MLETLLSVAVLCSTVLTIILISLPSRYESNQSSTDKTPQSTSGNTPGSKVSVQILVLGDIGRSPRMQYHALSIAKHGGHVDLIGYQESDLHPDVASNSNITVLPIPPPPSLLQTANKWLFLLFGPLKAICQTWYLWLILGYYAKPAKWMLVQNPPSIPSLAIAQLICFVRNTRLIIDWHNFGFTILSLKLGDTHPLVRISKWYETVFCRSAFAHLCVTNAMARVLREGFRIKSPIFPLHDRPPAHFQPIVDGKAQHAFLSSLAETTSSAAALQAGSKKLLVSSTSWTHDEDFSLLIDALCQYSKLATTSRPGLPEILAIITGKGPEKEMYLAQIRSLEKEGKLKKVAITTAWLKAEDYARLLACASLGVSLHTSSSGVDLPMKVVDMFGAGLPVVGWNRFEAWPELVTEGVNGRGFGSSAELSSHLIDLFGDESKLDRLQLGAREECGRRWDAEWDPVAGKILGLTS